MYKKKYMKYKAKYLAISSKHEGGANVQPLVPPNNPHDEGGADGRPLVPHVPPNKPQDVQNFKRVISNKFDFNRPRVNRNIAQMLFNPVQERKPPVINPDIKRINIKTIGSGVLICYIEINIREVREIMEKSYGISDEEILKLLTSYQKEIFSKLPEGSQYPTYSHIGLLYDSVPLTSAGMDIYKYREHEDIMAIISDDTFGYIIKEVEQKTWRVSNKLEKLIENNDTDIIEVFNDNSAVAATEVNLTFKIGGDKKTYNGPLYLLKYVFLEYLGELNGTQSSINKSVKSYYIKDWVSNVSIHKDYDNDRDILKIVIDANFTKEGIVYTDDSIDITFQLTIMQTDYYHDNYALDDNYDFDIVYKKPLMDDINLSELF